MNRAQFIQLGIALSVLVILVALSVGAGVYLESQKQRAVQLGQEVAQKQSEAVRIARAREALPVLEEAEGVVAQRLVPARDIVSFLERLEKQGKAQGASVKVLSVNPVQVESQSRISIALTITGSFDSVLRALGAIEYGPYDLSLTNVAVTTAGAEEAAGGWTASVTVSVGTTGEPVATKN